jgi:putative DNA primase/helicase
MNRAPLTIEEQRRRAAVLVQHRDIAKANGQDHHGAETGVLDFALPPHLAKQVTEFADAVRVAAPSEKLDAFTLCARQVFGLGTPDEFPLAEKGDRLQATAEAHGLVVEYGNDVVQRLLADARADPIVVDEFTPRVCVEEAVPTAAKMGAPLSSSTIAELVVKRASEIVPQPVVWLWPGRMAIGKQTLIGGEPGLGKSQIATALVAAVTTGGPWPHEERRAPLGNAIILSAEDGIADTIVPRLHAAGANCERAFIVSAVRNNDRLRTFNLQADLILLEQTLDRIGDVRLVVIDPISSYMGAIDSHKNTDVRAVLEAVGEMAERRHIAIVGITHFSKGAGQRAINAFMGSVAFIAAARAAFAVMKDSSDETRHLFLPVKNNLAPLGLGLAFRLVQQLIPGADGCGPASAVSWDSSPVTSTADEMMAANSGNATPHTAKAECIEFLETILANGWVEVADITAEAIGAGLHAEGKQLKDNKPMRDARAVLKVETHRDGFGKGARYFWALPGTPWAPSDPMGALSYERAPMDQEGRP